MELGLEEKKLLELLITYFVKLNYPEEIISSSQLYLETDGTFPAFNELKNLRMEKLKGRNSELTIIEEKEFGLESNKEFENYLFELYKCFRIYHLDKELIKIFKSYTRHLTLTKLKDDLKEFMTKIQIKN